MDPKTAKAGAWSSGLNGADWSAAIYGATLTANAFRTPMPSMGGFFVAFGLIFFALSTTIAWSYYGDIRKT